MRIVLRLLSLLLFAVVIAGCDTPEGVPTGTATVSASPTLTATPDATSTPESTATTEPATPTATPTAEPATQTPTSTPTDQPSTPSPSATSVAPVTLHLEVGESGDAGGGTLRFDAVENDSRCGVDVVCVWAGEATVVLTATAPSGEASEVRIVLSPGEGTATVDDLELRAYDLTPQPRSTEQIDPSAYSVSIDVTRG